MNKMPTSLLADLDDLTARIRRPMRWTLRHPLRAARRRRRMAAALTVIGVVAALLATRHHANQP